MRSPRATKQRSPATSEVSEVPELPSADVPIPMAAASAPGSGGGGSTAGTLPAASTWTQSKSTEAAAPQVSGFESFQQAMHQILCLTRYCIRASGQWSQLLSDPLQSAGGCAEGQHASVLQHVFCVVPGWGILMMQVIPIYEWKSLNIHGRGRAEGALSGLLVVVQRIRCKSQKSLC